MLSVIVEIAVFNTKSRTKSTSTDSSFVTSSPSLSLSTSFFAYPYNFIVSGDNNSNLYAVFILNAILFLILLG